MICRLHCSLHRGFQSWWHCRFHLWNLWAKLHYVYKNKRCWNQSSVCLRPKIPSKSRSLRPKIPSKSRNLRPKTPSKSRKRRLKPKISANFTTVKTQRKETFRRNAHFKLQNEDEIKVTRTWCVATHITKHWQTRFACSTKTYTNFTLRQNATCSC